MEKTKSPSQTIIEEVTSWPGVTTEPGRFGALAFKFERREIGHLHGERTLHIGLPKSLWHELHDAGRIDYHPVFPGKPGFGARALLGPDDVRDAIELLRLNYDRVIERYGLPIPS